MEKPNLISDLLMLKNLNNTTIENEDTLHDIFSTQWNTGGGDDGVIGLSINGSFVLAEAVNNITSPSSSSSPSDCVLCRYKLSPWLKAARVSFGSLIVLVNLVIFICLRRTSGVPQTLRIFLANVSLVDGLYGFGFLYHLAIGQ